ncbi:MAG: hypothetical protein ACRBN8_13460 [Nannocystales bacterium]
MPSALEPAPKVYGGDLRELLRSRSALLGALGGCGLIVGLTVLLAYQLSRDCVATFEQSWRTQLSYDLYNEAFSDTVLAECDTLEDRPCLHEMKTLWVEDGREVHTVAYNLAVTEACPAETDHEHEFEIEFEPGALMTLGVELVDEPAVPDARPEPPQEAQHVTDDQDARPAETSTEPDEQPDDTPTEPVFDRDRRLPPAKTPIRRTTPFDELPRPAVRKGNPFGDPDGWSDLRKDGDPWATAVMRALDQMSVGAFGAKMGEGTSKFQITLCRDGRVKKVQKKGGSLRAADQARVANAVRVLRLPKPPPTVASEMKGSCAKIKYTFVWSNEGVK